MTDWFDEIDDESGYGEIQIDDSELKKICDRVLQMVRLTTYAVRMEHEDVIIERKKKQKATEASGAVLGRLEYLGAKHLTDDKKNASSAFKIVWAGTPESAGIGNKFGAEVAVKVQRNTSQVRYWWMLSNDNPNMDVLCDAIGNDTGKWPGGEVNIFLEKEMPSEIMFVRSEVIAAEKTTEAAAAKK
jgi:hypothetical protein